MGFETEVKINNGESQSYHRKALRKMVSAKSTHYYLLHIWDGRYAAFWWQGIESELCIAVAEYHLEESGFPFAFISENFNEVREYINKNELEIMESSGLSVSDGRIKFIPKKRKGL